tara:strand:- start:2 stop:763 length:762 start_codon:yes stop_codon:yes gene_type:complete
MTKISGLIITFNEEKNIERCIRSMIPVCDEIIVIDSGSTDSTVDIANRLGARSIYNPFEGHIEQKNYAISKANYDYVLSLDADEELSEELIDQIIKLKRNIEYDAICFNRLTRYIDKWIYHCDWYPDTKLRLWNKNKGQWGGVNPHDIVLLTPGSRTLKIKGNLKHYSYNSISEHIIQTDKFTTIAARAAYQKGIRSSNFKIISRPLLKFLKDYVLRLGIADGKYGFVICFINSLSAMLKYAKIKDLQDGKKI